MKTIAIWFDRKKDSSGKDINLDLHINFWKLKKKNHNSGISVSSQENYFLDFGFKIDDIRELENLNIHFPFEIQLKNIDDIGKILCKNHELVKSVFNENYHMHDGNRPKQLSVQNNFNETLFNIYAIDFSDNSNDVKIQNVFDGTKLSIDLSSIIVEGNSAYYFRFRLKGDDVISNFKRNHEPKKMFFQSAFTEVETIDFRVNEKRNFNSSLAENICKGNEFKIQKIHFLLMRDAAEDFESQHINYTCRTLEPELWVKYIGNDYILENVIAYHWSEKVVKNGKIKNGKVKNIEEEKAIDSFNTLVKMKCYKTNIRTIIIYVLIIFLMSVSFNLFSSYIFYSCQGKPVSGEEIVKGKKEHAQQINSKKTVHNNKEVLSSKIGGE